MQCNKTGLRFNRKIYNENERRLQQSYWEEVTRLYGTSIDYFTYEYSITSHDFFYGEQPLAPYKGPTQMLMLAQFNNDSLLLAKFGIRTDADITFIVPIISFRAAFGSNAAEPKSGDLVRLTELGWDRPGGVNDINTLAVETTACSAYEANSPLNGICRSGIANYPAADCKTDSKLYSAYNTSEAFERLSRGANIYEITERRDENLTMQYNMLQGHYVWILHAKRFDYSYQPDAPREPGSDQVSDETLYGKLSGGTNYSEEPKKYDQNISNEIPRIWDYGNTNHSVYGNY